MNSGCCLYTFFISIENSRSIAIIERKEEMFLRTLQFLRAYDAGDTRKLILRAPSADNLTSGSMCDPLLLIYNYENFSNLIGYLLWTIIIL